MFGSGWEGCQGVFGTFCTFSFCCLGLPLPVPWPLNLDFTFISTPLGLKSQPSVRLSLCSSPLPAPDIWVRFCWFLRSRTDVRPGGVRLSLPALFHSAQDPAGLSTWVPIVRLGSCLRQAEWHSACASPASASPSRPRTAVSVVSACRDLGPVFWWSACLFLLGQRCRLYCLSPSPVFIRGTWRVSSCPCCFLLCLYFCCQICAVKGTWWSWGGSVCGGRWALKWGEDSIWGSRRGRPERPMEKWLFSPPKRNHFLIPAVCLAVVHFVKKFSSFLKAFVSALLPKWISPGNLAFSVQFSL